MMKVFVHSNKDEGEKSPRSFLSFGKVICHDKYHWYSCLKIPMPFRKTFVDWYQRDCKKDWCVFVVTIYFFEAGTFGFQRPHFACFGPLMVPLSET